MEKEKVRVEGEKLIIPENADSVENIDESIQILEELEKQFPDPFTGFLESTGSAVGYILRQFRWIRDGRAGKHNWD